jgi:hypothetical protein
MGLVAGVVASSALAAAASAHPSITPIIFLERIRCSPSLP